MWNNFFTLSNHNAPEENYFCTVSFIRFDSFTKLLLTEVTIQSTFIKTCFVTKIINSFSYHY